MGKADGRDKPARRKNKKAGRIAVAAYGRRKTVERKKGREGERTAFRPPFLSF